MHGTEGRYLALLRGINVGGKNIIKMAELKSCFEDMGFKDVTTFIQSGNVLFMSPDSRRDTLIKKIERALSRRFHYDSRVALVTHQELRDAVRRAPKGFGKKPAAYRYDIIFLKRPMTAKRAMQDVSLKEGVDDAHAGKNVLYFSRLISKAAQSRLPRIIGSPAYRYMTIRNWNTTTKLLEIMETAAAK